jgi:hypothetical protein
MRAAALASAGRRAARLLLGAAAAAVVGAGSAPSPRLPQAPRCPLFPANSPWHTRVDKLPVAANSATMIAAIGPEATVEPHFGSGLSRQDNAPIGFPYAVVSSKQKKVRLSFLYRSDKGPYPIPRNVPIQGGRNSTGDRHAIIVDRDRCILYELWALYPEKNGWRAGSGAIWNLRSNRLRPNGLTSADAAGLPILPALVRYDEVARGAVRHALRFTAPRTRAAHVYPARHDASDTTDPNLPPMGLRLRLRGNFDVSRYPPQARVILTALKRYGMLLADNGLPWYLGGVPDKRWNNRDLATLNKLKGSDFEVVDTSSLPKPGNN